MVGMSNLMRNIFASLALLVLPVHSFAESDLELVRKVVETAKAVEGKKIADYSLIDQDKKSFKLNSYAGKPLLVSFIYTTCPDICNSIVATLVPAIEEVKRALGDKFNAVIVGFDAEYDTPEMMREFGDHHETDFDLVRFASGDAETIARMVKDFGFYFEQLEDGGFNHLGMITVVDADGVIYSQIYKTRINAADLRVPLNQLITGNIPGKKTPTLLSQLKALCLKYDPETGEYYVDYAYIFGVFLQALALILITWFFFKEDIKKMFGKMFKKSKENL